MKLVVRCDGKVCGQGKPAGPRYICPHNNLAAMRPDIACEWDYGKNTDRPEDYAPSSRAYKWWKCVRGGCDCHQWKATINNRANGRGCPYCNKGKVCPHNNLATKRPDIAREWDYDKNGDKPEDYAASSRAGKW